MGPLLRVAFDLKSAVRTFGLIEERDVDLFVAVESVEPSRYLVEWLAEFSRVALGINTEMANSTYIIIPVLVEAVRRAGIPANALPGVGFDVARAQGLTGYCDYLIARSAAYCYIQAPIMAVVEAKNDDLIAGLGQCAVEMVAIRLFNERDQSPLPIVYGCVTNGDIWKFLKLEGPTLSIDRVDYHLDHVAKILSILVSVIRG